MKILTLLFVAVCFFGADKAEAKLGRISNKTLVYKSSDESSKKLVRLRKGTRVLIMSREPENGFYKIKTKSGKIGWVKEADIRMARPRKDRLLGDGSSEKKMEITETTYSKFRIRGLFGLTGIGFNDVEALTEIPSISSGTYFGLDILYYFSPKFAAVLHAEYLTKGVQIDDAGSGNTFLFDIKSLPVYLGAEYDFVLSEKFIIGLQGLVGMGLNSELKSTLDGGSTPNETIYGGSPIGFAVSIDIIWQISQKIGIVGDLGYRIMKLKASSPTTVGNGSELFNGTGSSPQDVALDFSGIYFGAGIQLAF